MTNAYKYAYPPGTPGEIRVRVRRVGGDAATVVVEDDGVGWAAAGEARGTGLGTRIVNAMATTLGSTIRHDPSHAGTRMSLTFPLS